ncbi:MAG: helix-turn-helix transcriptional regulator [Synergistaceae bacterium]|nr:helix-turn-helix transcriptional regulator [Synergistaceae bacterium]
MARLEELRAATLNARPLPKEIVRKLYADAQEDIYELKKNPVHLTFIRDRDLPYNEIIVPKVIVCLSYFIMNNAYDRWTEAQKNPEYWAELAKLDFAVELNSKMEEQKLSRTELAKKVSVSKAYISKILGGYANFTIESMSKLAFALFLPVALVEVKDKTASEPSASKAKKS